MLALPCKRCAESSGWEAVAELKSDFGGDVGKRFAAGWRELEQKRVAANNAVDALDCEGGGDSEPSYAEPVADDGDGESARNVKTLRLYAAELLSVERRCPNADEVLGYECAWLDAWAAGPKSGNEPEKKKRFGLLSLRRAESGNDSKEADKAALRGAVRLERVSTLYNLACAESAAGSALERSSDRAIKAACRHFQRAAGLFEYLRRSAKAGGHRAAEAAWGAAAPNDDKADLRDLSPASLEMCAHLMLAQAQACFYEKAVASHDDDDDDGAAAQRVKPMLVARLAAHAAQCYWRAVALAPSSARLKKPAAGDVDDAPAAPDFVTKARAQPALKGLEDSLCVFLEFQARTFEAAAQLWSARQHALDAEQTGAGYGLQLAHLALCLRHCDAATRLADRAPKAKKFFDADMVKSVEGLRAHVLAQVEEVSRDNAAIYRERVPAEAELAAIAAVSLAKATPPHVDVVGLAGAAAAALGREWCTDAAASGPRSLLRGLVPRSARSAAEAHADVARRDARGALEACADADELGRAALASLGLPRDLDDLDDAVELACSGALPRHLADKARALRALREDAAANGAAPSSRATLDKAHARLVAARDRAEAAVALAGEDSEDDVPAEGGEKERQQRAIDVMLGKGAAQTSKRGGAGLARLRVQLEAAAASDGALRERLDDAGVQRSLQLLDAALDREHAVAGDAADGAEARRSPAPADALVSAAASCRAALRALGRNGEERLTAARQLQAVAAHERTAALDCVDALGDAGLPFLAVDDDEADDGHGALPLLQSGGGSLDASAALRDALQARYDALVAPCVDAAAQSAIEQRHLVEELAAARAAVEEEARRDANARAATEALQRVTDGARALDELVQSLAEGASFYAELARCAAALPDDDAASSATPAHQDKAPPDYSPSSPSEYAPARPAPGALAYGAHALAASSSTSSFPRGDSAASLASSSSGHASPPLWQPVPLYDRGDAARQRHPEAPEVLSARDALQRQTDDDSAFARRLEEEDRRLASAAAPTRAAPAYAAPAYAAPAYAAPTYAAPTYVAPTYAAPAPAPSYAAPSRPTLAYGNPAAPSTAPSYVPAYYGVPPASHAPSSATRTDAAELRRQQEAEDEQLARALAESLDFDEARPAPARKAPAFSAPAARAAPRGSDRGGPPPPFQPYAPSAGAPPAFGVAPSAHGASDGPPPAPYSGRAAAPRDAAGPPKPFARRADSDAPPPLYASRGWADDAPRPGAGSAPRPAQGRKDSDVPPAARFK
ncbi:BRO1-like domain-containing protein [Pelagophyceae sp. CCMP2097]|nr:BRO1-like domain-containing protein [Pelagophyceae sp. CCMP2097]